VFLEADILNPIDSQDYEITPTPIWI